MPVAQHGSQATDQGGIGQQRVDVEWHVGHADAVAPRGHRGVQVGQCLRVIQPGNLWLDAVEQVEHSIRFSHEGFQPTLPVHTVARRVLIEHLGSAGAGFFWWQICQREVIGALVVMAGFLESRAAFFLHQPGQRFGEVGTWIARRCAALSFDKQGPARSQATQRVVEPRRRGDQLALRRAVQIRPTKTCRALERAILVQYHARRDQPGPGQPVGQQRGPLVVFGKVQHVGFSLYVQ